jgi:hypothetical protein
MYRHTTIHKRIADNLLAVRQLKINGKSRRHQFKQFDSLDSVAPSPYILENEFLLACISIRHLKIVCMDGS